MRILVVEDDHKIAGALKQGLERQRYAVDVVFNGDDGLAMATTEDYDLIILDRMLPSSIDGIGILKTLRSDNNHTPILLLTAKDRTLDRAEGLNAGADDYLVKPFAFVELVARVRALLRRSKGESATNTLSESGVLLDRENFKVVREDIEIRLTAREFALLEYLMLHNGRLVTKDQITAHVWDYDANVLPNTIEVYIGYLRNKLDKPFKKKLIETKRGFGYVFGGTG